MQKYGEAVYGTRGAITTPKDWGGFTQKGKTVYMHVLNRPADQDYIFVPELKQKIKKAFSFDDKREVKFKQLAEGSFVYLPAINIGQADTIIELEIE